MEVGYEFCPAFTIRGFVFCRTLLRSTVLIRNFFLSLIEKMPDAPNFLMKTGFGHTHVIGLQKIEERKRQSAIVFTLKELFGRCLRDEKPYGDHAFAEDVLEALNVPA